MYTVLLIRINEINISEQLTSSKKTRPFLDTKTAALIYSSMILPMLTYSGLDSSMILPMLTYSGLATLCSISDTLKRKRK